MSRKTWQRIFSVLLMAGMLISFVQPLNTAAYSPRTDFREGAMQVTNSLDKVEGLVLEEIQVAGITDFFVWMTEKADLSPANDLKTKQEKGQFVFDTLRSTAERTQRSLRAYLDQQGLDYEPFYIANKILVKNGDLARVEALASRGDVAKITANHQYQLQEPFIDEVPEAPAAIETNITFVNADDVWGLGVTGVGTLLAGNDTGLDWDHPALINQYRGWDGATADHNYNWWDATGTYPMVPGDGHGHGTHTTGTMVGDDGADNQIGMAPGAQTIHCKNMTDGGSGSDATFTDCFEWDLAPWDLSGGNPDPGMAPDAINNSWGYFGGGQPQFVDEIEALQAAGIAVEVSAGNEGSSCSSLRSPGDYEQVITTGSVNHAGGVLPGTLTGFSSRGPSSLYPDAYIPDIMAPGENIRSSIPGGGYQGGWSGTSMSGPHVVGLIGLIWSANPALFGQVEQTYQIITDTAVPLTGQPGSSCGGDYTDGPNNDWGYGTIDSLAAVQLAIAMGGAGWLDGTVTESGTGDPIQNANVLALHEDGFAWNVMTDATGYYTMTVAAGMFDVTASHPQYMAETVSGVEVITDTLTTQNFSLIPRGRLFGYVTDLDNGFPLVGATVMADDGTTATTDGDGFYEMYLDPGTYEVTASMQDYAPETATVVIVSGADTQQDFALEAAVTFVPSPVEIILDLGATGSVPATLTNRQPWEYNFQFREVFVDFEPAVMGQTEVNVPAGPETAPAGTAVASVPYSPRADGSITIPRYSSINANPNVLLLNADEDNDFGSPIQQMLVAYGDLGVVDLFDARFATPTLEQLQAYDVVVTWSNYVYADATGIGNVLADYVDAGGKVVNLMFSMGTHGWNMMGRFMNENYTAMNGTNILFSTSCLGTYDPGHPIMDGVTNVCDLYRLSGTYLTPGSTAVANWQDGADLRSCQGRSNGGFHWRICWALLPMVRPNGRCLTQRHQLAGNSRGCSLVWY
jgi:subtilisin family serine protease